MMMPTNNQEPEIKQMKRFACLIITFAVSLSMCSGRYIGEYRNNLKEGKYYYYFDGNVDRGVWENDIYA
jgi:hypothetical protein